MVPFATICSGYGARTARRAGATSTAPLIAVASAQQAMPSDHAFARTRRGKSNRPLSLAQLCREGLILVRRPGAPGLYADLLALCHAKGLKPRIVAEVERMMTNLNLVAAGVGLTVVPASMVGAHAHAITYCPLAASASQP